MRLRRLNEEEITIDGKMDASNEPRMLPAESWSQLNKQDRENMVLLIILYLLQGIPLGLITGSLTFLLKGHLSYADMATFSLASYPYSMKLLWSPIVDSIFHKGIGRRKTWIIPTQILLAITLWKSSSMVDELLHNGHIDVGFLASLMFFIILLAATQDIAVDGWALTLLSKANLSWASTAQSVGLQMGYFLSYTIFLALNSKEFCNEYIFSVPQSEGLVGVGAFMRICAAGFVLVTLWLLAFKKEESFLDDEDANLKLAYRRMLQIITLRNVALLALVLLLCKIGFVAGELLSPLKLVEQGFRLDRLALAAVIDFPVQMYLGVKAATWSQGSNPLHAFLIAIAARITLSLLGVGLVWWYPTYGHQGWYYPALLVASIATSFTSTVTFVCMGAFFARISDPVVGGTYLTLLNTLHNLGGTWPKWPLFKVVEYLSVKACAGSAETCSADGDCASGHCVTEVDGYYPVTIVSVFLGYAVLYLLTAPLIKRLQHVPEKEWRVVGRDTA